MKITKLKFIFYYILLNCLNEDNNSIKKEINNDEYELKKQINLLKNKFNLMIIQIQIQILKKNIKKLIIKIINQKINLNL